MDYLDTSYVIALAVKSDANHGLALELERYVADPVASQLVVAELYTYYSRVLSSVKTNNLKRYEGRVEELVEAMVEYSLQRCKARLMNVDMNYVVSQVGNVAPHVPLRTLDLMHLLAARSIGANRIVTLDKEIARKRTLVREVLGLEVLSPFHTTGTARS